MGLRFKKSVKLGKGVKLNLNKKSAGISFGGKGHRTTINSKGRVTGTVGIPGTGLSYSTTIGKKSSKGRKKSTTSKNRQQYEDSSWLDAAEDFVDNWEIPEAPSPKYAAKNYRTCGIILQVLSVILFVLSLLLALVFPFAWLFVAFSCLLFWVGRKSKALGKKLEQDAVSEEVIK